MSDAFRLSRIQAAGWNAARGVPESRLADLDEEGIAALNPYSTDPERIRWRVGFDSARETSGR